MLAVASRRQLREQAGQGNDRYEYGSCDWTWPVHSQTALHSHSFVDRPRLALSFWQRNEHPRLAAVPFVRGAVCLEQIMLFELKRDEDVGRRNEGEHQMAQCHQGRRPKRDEKA